MTPNTCPNCDKKPVPIAYGLPGPLMMEAARAGTIRLGGCIVWGDAPVAACAHCDAALWGHGVFKVNDNLRVRLGRRSHRFEAMLSDDGSLWLSDEVGVATISAEDVGLVMMMAVIETFDDAEHLQRWLAARRIDYTGVAEGMLGQVIIDSDDGVRMGAESGEVTTLASGRLLLHLLRGLTHIMKLRSVDALATYFEDHGGIVTRSPVPVG